MCIYHIYIICIYTYISITYVHIFILSQYIHTHTESIHQLVFNPLSISKDLDEVNSNLLFFIYKMLKDITFKNQLYVVIIVNIHMIF